MDKYAELTLKFRDENFRKLDHVETFNQLRVELETFHGTDWGEETLKILTEVFRLLRNACIACPENQVEIMQQGIPLCVVRLLCRRTTVSESSDKMKICGLQFCGNLVADNPITRAHLWKITFPDFFKHILSKNMDSEETNCVKMFNVCAMVLYNCLMSPDSLSALMVNPSGQHIIKMLCNHLKLPVQQEWTVLCIREHFLTQDKFLDVVFAECSSNVQCRVLEVLCNLLSEENSTVKVSWTDTTVMQVSDQLLNRMHNILQGEVTNVESERLHDDECIPLFSQNKKLGNDAANLQTVGILLKTLCWLTATPTLLVKDMGEGIISTAIDFLRLICTNGQPEGQDKLNISQPETSPTKSCNIQKRRQNGVDNDANTNTKCNNVKEASYDTGVTFSGIHFDMPNLCFRRDLVRLIGNLCFQNPGMQNQVRALGGIRLILESCTIDDKNPFMQQWAVFAVRNLCENNLQNQAEIAQLEKLGVADSPVLRDMGLTAVQGDDGKMRVMQTKN